ncbi:MAG: peptidoglycan editing factor PgeF [Candidatus Kerfeldbacteria bacterium CG08_land_8_20_14_0_20_40_16]|uniref:Purine nucleoside phosphorylase n=1 Tax=Candidatus Kerfeldbacteria bacterium CG08_land_8_20_14_0_20_40_16 TaxID=2014244 RepID=A0A2H0YVE8_9BACT|nr:MAG: peptidoglycan editing factor PgeF [Candidatus Kerfeldbacteria bacterium CG08_land_8_20_14_0_20_40_16]
MVMLVDSNKLARFSNLKLAISTKRFGNLSFQHFYLNEEDTKQNRSQFFSALKIKANQVVNIALGHTARIFWVQKKDGGKGALNKSSLISFYDGLITVEKNLFLMITIADCFPVFYFDSQKECIGLTHSGWRGILACINRRMVADFKKRVKSNPKDILVYIGPGIQRCHFEVEKDVFNQFHSAFGEKIAFEKNNYFWVDLSEAIKVQLIESGIKEENIEQSAYCTYCEEKLFSSYRRDKKNYIAQGAIIGLID